MACQPDGRLIQIIRKCYAGQLETVMTSDISTLAALVNAYDKLLYVTRRGKFIEDDSPTRRLAKMLGKPMTFNIVRKISRSAYAFGAALGLFALLAQQPAMAEAGYTPIPVQYIAALGDSASSSGTGAETWGLWNVDPGPRGVRLSNYESLKAADGVAPAEWTFDGSDWWLEEHGLIMEQPGFPISPGKYAVTGYREKTAMLTVYPKDADGAQKWELDNNATLYDVTHLRCRAARYTPSAGNMCSPDRARQSAFPVAPGASMPPVDGCNKQDYQVLVVIGMFVDS